MTTTISSSTKPASTRNSLPSAATRRDRAAQIILGVCAVGALAATAATAGEVIGTDGPSQVAETWRLAGLPVFAGLFAILAVAPRRVAGLWELVIANKVALVAAGATYLAGVEGGSDFVYVDGVLVILLVTAYVLSRGWTAWSRR